MARKKTVRKVTLEVFCFAGDVRVVTESLDQWFGDCEAYLFGASPKVTKPTDEEEKKARPDLEALDE